MASIRDNIRERLVRRLRQFWQVDPDEVRSTIVPSRIRDHVDAVASDGISDALADEVLDALSGNSDSGAFSSFEEDDEDVPLVVRIKPRGYHEDDWRARTTPERPWPVVLVHGTGGAAGEYQEMAADLRADGWAVFATTYGVRATNPIEHSAEQVGAYIDQVLAATGAKQAIVVGHSQGGLVLRQWMRFLGGGVKVRHMVCLAVPNVGTTIGGLASPMLSSPRSEGVALRVAETVVGPVVHQMLIGSDFLTRLNAESLLDADVTYTCIATRSDTLVQPPDSCFLAGPAGPAGPDGPGKERVHNVWVQDLEPHAVALHEYLPADSRVRRLVTAALRAVAKG